MAAMIEVYGALATVRKVGGVILWTSADNDVALMLNAWERVCESRSRVYDPNPIEAAALRAAEEFRGRVMEHNYPGPGDAY